MSRKGNIRSNRVLLGVTTRREFAGGFTFQAVLGHLSARTPIGVAVGVQKKGGLGIWDWGGVGPGPSRVARSGVCSDVVRRFFCRSYPLDGTLRQGWPSPFTSRVARPPCWPWCSGDAWAYSGGFFGKSEGRAWTGGETRPQRVLLVFPVGVWGGGVVVLDGGGVLEASASTLPVAGRRGVPAGGRDLHGGATDRGLRGMDRLAVGRGTVTFLLRQKSRQSPTERFAVLFLIFPSRRESDPLCNHSLARPSFAFSVR